MRNMVENGGNTILYSFWFRTVAHDDLKARQLQYPRTRTTMPWLQRHDEVNTKWSQIFGWAYPWKPPTLRRWLFCREFCRVLGKVSWNTRDHNRNHVGRRCCEWIRRSEWQLQKHCSIHGSRPNLGETLWCLSWSSHQDGNFRIPMKFTGSKIQVIQPCLFALQACVPHGAAWLQNHL